MFHLLLYVFDYVCLSYFSSPMISCLYQITHNVRLCKNIQKNQLLLTLANIAKRGKAIQVVEFWERTMHGFEFPAKSIFLSTVKPRNSGLQNCGNPLNF